MKKSYNVINLRGEEEQFSFKKVYQNAKRTGASESLAKRIAENVQQTVYPGIKASEIFKTCRNQISTERLVEIKFLQKK